MKEIGEEGESFNFSAAGRAANFEPDLARVRRYDPYLKKYKRISLLVLVAGLFAAAVATRLWITGHGGWSGLMVVLALLLFLGAYMLHQGAIGTVYSSGLLVPAVITSLKPLQLIALANMSRQEDSVLYGLQRITLTELPLHSLQTGERVPCAAAFGGLEQESWGYFEARPLVWATADSAIIRTAAASISNEEWARLNQLISKLPTLEDDQTAFYRDDLTFIDVK